MKKLKIYLETSVINFIFDKSNPKEKEITLKLFDDIKKGQYEAFISELVIAEIDKAPHDIAVNLRNAISEINLIELTISEEVKFLADKYEEQGIIPRKYRNDALHIAIATVHNLDVLVSWNFEHIVKVRTKKEVMGINLLMGYKEIEIYSPWEVAENDE